MNLKQNNVKSNINVLNNKPLASNNNNEKKRLSFYDKE